jgi:CHAT domain-containing protein
LFTYRCVLEVSDKQQDQYTVAYMSITRIKSVAKIRVDDLTTRVLKRFDYWIDKYKLDEKNDLQLVGEYLYNILLPNGSDVRIQFEADYDLTHSQTNRMLLTLVFREKAEELAKYPWEFLYMPARLRTDEKPKREGFFLAGQQTDLILARFVPDVNPQFERAKQLRILVVFSHPYIPGYSDLDTADTREAIKAIQSLAKPDGLVQVRLVESPTWEQLEKVLNKPEKPGEEPFKPHIVHFIGHGHKDQGLALKMTAKELQERKEEGTLAEEAAWHKSIADLFPDDRPPRLVFLQACETAKSPNDPQNFADLSDLARDLVHTKIPAVVAMQYSIKTQDAALFAKEFYKVLSQGLDVGDAVRAAREVMGIPEYGGKGSWSDRRFGTPVLYLQSEGAIVEIPPPSAPEPTAPSAQAYDPYKRVPCPNQKCEGRPLPSENFCVVCGLAVMLCPECIKRNEASLIEKVNGMCAKCGYSLRVRQAPGAIPVSSRPAEDEALQVAKAETQRRA